MRTIVALLILTLLTAATEDKDLKLIRQDGHFSKLPTTSKIIGHEVLIDKTKRFGYLVFEAPSYDLANWILQSKLVLTSKQEIFDNNIVVWPNNRPAWFKNSIEKFTMGELYYAQRQSDRFTSLISLDIAKNIIHIEYEIGF